MKHEPIDDHAERKRISALIDRCEKEQTMKDTIYREDAIGACAYETIECYEARKAIRALPSADRPSGYIHIDDVYRLVAGHSDYHGDSILSAFTCLTEGKDVKPIQPLDRPQEWIPCGERMPEYRKTVLISTFWGVKTGFLDGTEAYGDFWEIIEDDATASLNGIYAWMPLPKPWSGRRMKG